MAGDIYNANVQPRPLGANLKLRPTQRRVATTCYVFMIGQLTR